jgi:hypothetical protein
MKRQRIFLCPNGRSTPGPMPERVATVEPRTAALAFTPRNASQALIARLVGRN